MQIDFKATFGDFAARIVDNVEGGPRAYLGLYDAYSAFRVDM